MSLFNSFFILFSFFPLCASALSEKRKNLEDVCASILPILPNEDVTPPADTRASLT